MFKEIKKLHKQGYKNIVGLDEAGRGPLAGPVIASAVALEFPISNFQFPKKFQILNYKFKKIRDSKKLSAKQREEWYKILTEHPDIKWEVGIVSEKIIDKINILEATKLAMRRAVKKLNSKLKLEILERTSLRYSVNLYEIDFLIIDGNFVLDKTDWSSKRKFAQKSADFRPLFQQKAIVKADEKIFLCAATSIIAKVTRDRIMQKMHKKYPEYGFDKHKGYGTKEHLRALKKYGPCKMHRKSFGPVKRIINNQ
jgi:ribonuclease HII